MKIFFISYGTGGAEIFSKIKNNYSNYSKCDCEMIFISISPYSQKKMDDSIFIEEKVIIDYIKAEKPDIIVNERSNGLSIQNAITKTCKELDICNICVLDFYNNDYETLFKDGIPDVLFCPSESVKLDLVNSGIIEESNIRVVGNPTFERFDIAEKAIKTNKTSHEKNIIYLSQGSQNIGLTQYEIFKEFYEVLTKKGVVFKIHVKPHPQEVEHSWENYLKGVPKAKIYEFDDRDDIMKECLLYDLMVGYNSTVLLRGMFLEIPAIMLELGDIDIAIDKFIANENILQKHPYIDFERNSLYKMSKAFEDLFLKFVANY